MWREALDLWQGLLVIIVYSIIVDFVLRCIFGG